MSFFLGSIKIADTFRDTTGSKQGGNYLENEYYDYLFDSVKKMAYGDNQLNAKEENDIKNAVMNSMAYAEEMIRSKDGLNDGEKNGKIGIWEWCTDSTYEFLGLDSSIQEDRSKMFRIYDALDTDGNGELDERELMSFYLYADTLGNNSDNKEKSTKINGDVNSEDKKAGLLSLITNVKDRASLGKVFRELHNNIFGSFEDDYFVMSNIPHINGVIEDSMQGMLGDCWLLTGLNAFSYTEKGAEILKETIKDNSNGTYTVNLKGVNRSYNFSSKEITQARANGNYSSGDDDVLLMEIAVEKLLTEIRDGKVSLPEGAPKLIYGKDEDKTRNPLNGGYSTDLLYILTGKTANNQYNVYHPNNKAHVEKYNIQDNDPHRTENTGTSLNYAYDNIEKNSTNVWGTISFSGLDENGARVKDIDGKEVSLTEGNTAAHVWTIKSVKGDLVTIVNPWSSSNEVTVKKEEIQKYITDIYFCIL